MPLTARKRKSGGLEHGIDQEPLTKKGRVAAPETRVTKRPGRARQGKSTDAGRESSKDFLTAATSGKSRTALVDDMARQIRKEADDVIQYINKRAEPVDKLAGGISSEKLTSLLPGCDTPTRLDEGQGGSGFAQLRLTLDHLTEVVQGYQSLALRASQITKPEVPRWAQDSQDLARLNEKAFSIAADQVNLNLRPVEQKGVNGKPVFEDDIEAMAWEWFSELRGGEAQTTWGMTASTMVDHVSSLERLVKGNEHV